MISRKKKAALVPVALKKDKKSPNYEVDDDLLTLLHQYGAFKQSLITKEWLLSLPQAWHTCITQGWARAFTRPELLASTDDGIRAVEIRRCQSVPTSQQAEIDAVD